ncbi:phenoloxidase subunit 1-like isoform X2 [Daphnia carinata]|uniref:phenoloxidase subunit 1-like isoform X2 n=1 Tax=Daphnia carinata TaxID=120202 RepID=UPI00257A4203|nr:phenoloxidase subunit 1-like isoform X2 [Daphnia carinata]
MSDLELQQRKVLNLFERVSQPFSPKPNITFEFPDFVSPTDFSPKPGLVPPGSASTDGLNIPELDLVKTIPRGRLFSNFHPGHREAAYTLVKIFKDVPTVAGMLNLAAHPDVRDAVNEHIFVYALSAALIQRKDARSLRLPPIYEIFPGKFFETKVRSEAQTSVQQQKEPAIKQPIIIDKNFAATNRVVENRLSYFREDLGKLHNCFVYIVRKNHVVHFISQGINSHHWHWHLIFPVEATGEIINPPDRRGELFYYMHQQILARYDAERIANGLARVTSYHDWDEPIIEAYFPKLTNANGAIHWASRPAGLVLKDINIPDEGVELGIEFQIQNLELWRTRILHAIHKGSVVKANGEVVQLDETTGTNTLGELIEASQWSADKLFYGDLHNFGHIAVCYIHDPDRSHSENMGVMGDSVTAMRDPIFYRWHKFIDSLFQQFKATLNPYTAQQLTLEGITVNNVEVRRNASPNNPGLNPPKNLIITGWQESIVELDRGLDFSSLRPVQARVTHLQHEDFFYRIQVTNSTKTTQEIVFRIFLAPIADEAGRPFSFREQRLLMIELDKFVVRVTPGANRVKRKSDDSSVTIPFERTFRDLEAAAPATPLAPGGVPTDLPTDRMTNFCGCGWPDHFLVPRGAPNPGMPFTLFAMATSWEEDRVVNGEDTKKLCRNAASYCGVLDEKYPDKRPMGFPFDRPPDKMMTTLAKFVEKSPNMKTTEIRIQFEDRIIRRFPQQ